MKDAISQTARCRKVLKSTGSQTNGACNELPKAGEELESSELAERVTRTISDCLKCQRRVIANIGIGHHVMQTITRTKRMLEGGLKDI